MRRMTRGISGANWEGSPLAEDLVRPSDLDRLSDVFWSEYLDGKLTTIGDPEWGHEKEVRRIFSSRKIECFIVGYTALDGNYRRDLLVFDRKLEEPFVTEVVPGEYRGHFFRDADRDRFIAGARPAVVFAPRPEITPLAGLAGIASPLVGVSLPSQNEPTSTAGVMAQNAAGQVGFTVALHALEEEEEEDGTESYVGQPVLIGGQNGVVISIDLMSDSAFVGLEPPIGKIMVSPVKLRATPPYLGEGAWFEGVGSGRNTTEVVSVSPTMLLNHKRVQRQLLTNPATSRGDSGSALRSGDEEVLGFCFGDSGTACPIPCTMWIWAKSVFAAHQLS